MSDDDEWVKAAMADDSIVVDLLVRLNEAVSTPEKLHHSSVLPLEWTVRQRRTRTAIQPKKPTAAARASPTTPLSWSGATSLSGGGGGGGGFEESSRSPPSKPARSKVTAATETTTSKRSRKKKTLSELKEEEALLLKERKHLKRELGQLRVALEKQRATNENLKRLKLDFPSRPVAEAVATEEAIYGKILQNVASCVSNPSILPPGVTGKALDDLRKPSSPKSLPEVQSEIDEKEPKFMLPDLNLPLEEDSSSEVLHGIR